MKKLSNKKRILGFASLVIVLCYIVSMVALYIVGLNNEHSYFYRFTENYYDEFASKVYTIGIELDDSKFTEENFMYSVFSPFWFIQVVVILLLMMNMADKEFAILMNTWKKRNWKNFGNLVKKRKVFIL